MHDACNSILRAICQANGHTVEDVILNLDPILSNVAYKDLVENLFGTESCCVAPTIPLITKAYEESFMREAIHSKERLCVMDSKCECNFISKEHGFIGVEFLLPNEAPSDVRQTCIMCHRRTVQTLFYDLLYSGRAFKGVIQRFGNMCMPLPAVSHQRNRYSVVVQGGVKYIKQLNMEHVQDFHNPFPTGH